MYMYMYSTLYIHVLIISGGLIPVPPPVMTILGNIHKSGWDVHNQ